MPRNRPRSTDAIEQDFLDALERLVAKRPQNHELREKIRRGKDVKINISNVALEAGRARVLIALENCRYPRVREKVLAAGGLPSADPSSRADVIDKLRAQIVDLKAKLATAMDHAADHFEQRTKAERQIASQKAIIERLQRQIEKGAKRENATVVALFGDRRDEDPK